MITVNMIMIIFMMMMMMMMIIIIIIIISIITCINIGTSKKMTRINAINCQTVCS